MTAASLSYCGQEVRTHDRERFLTSLFAPSTHREALFALYAFNLEVAKTAEVVSEAMLGRIRLQWWREALDGIYAGTPRKHAVVEPLGAAVHEYALPRELFDRLIDCRELDLEDAPLDDFVAFENYAAGTSGTVNRLAAMILGVREETALQAAEHVGTAWAMIGLLRAIPFHAAQKRIFLPRALIDQHGLQRSDLFELRRNDAIVGITKEIAEQAKGHLKAARKARGHFSRAALAALLPATVAQQHLTKLARCGWDPLDPNAQRPNHSLALKVFIAYLLRRF